MPTVLNKRIDTLVAGGVTIEYSASEIYNKYELTGGGGANLTGGITIRQLLADPVIKDLVYNIRYEGDLVYTGGNTITVFGRVLTAEEARQELDIVAVYDGVAWQVDIFYDMTTPGAVTLASLNSNIYADDVAVQAGVDDTKVFTSLKLKNWWNNILNNVAVTFKQLVTFELAPIFITTTINKVLATDASKKPVSIDLTEQVHLPITFEADELGDHNIILNINTDKFHIIGYVTHTVDGSDDATVEFKVAGSLVGTFTVAKATSIGDKVIDNDVTCTVSKGDLLTFTTSKPTPGGKLLITLSYIRIL